MNSTEIVEAIKSYVNDDRCRFAVLIDGEWGTGKTYLWEHNIRKNLEANERGKTNPKKILYISLYGVQSLELLSKELLLKCVESTSGVKKAAGISSQIIGGISKVISLNLGRVTIDFSKDNTINNLVEHFNLQNSIICIDDLERCAIPINELLGFINNLVEHAQCKVILISDEKKIGTIHANTNLEMKYLTLLSGKKLDLSTKAPENEPDTVSITSLKENVEELYGDNCLYKITKEKVIGVTLKYTPQLENEYKNIIAETPLSANLATLLQAKKNTILNIENNPSFDPYNARITNIRTLNKAVQAIKHLYEVLEKNNMHKSDYVIDKYLKYLVIIVERFDNDKKLFDWDAKSRIAEVVFPDQPYFKIKGYRFIDDIITGEKVSTQEVCQITKKLLEEEKQENEKEKEDSAAKKLENWYLLDDKATFDKLLQQLKKEIRSGIYTIQRLHEIVGLLYAILSYNIIEEETVNNVLSCMYQFIETSLIQETDYLTSDYGFTDDTIKESYKEAIDKIRSILSQKRKTEEEKRYAKIWESENWANELSEYCRKHNSDYLLEENFLNSMTITELLRKLSNATPTEIRTLHKAMQLIYSFDDSNDYDNVNRESLTTFLQGLEAIHWSNKFRETNGNWLIDLIKNIIRRSSN